MRRWSAFFMAVFLAGCVALPGDLQINKSAFDGTEEISTVSAWICQPGSAICHIKLGLHRTSAMPKDEIVLTVVVRDAGAIGTGASLHLNIDRVFVDLNGLMDIPVSEVEADGYGSHVVSTQEYMVNRELIERMVNGTSVYVKIDMFNSYVEAPFSRDGRIEARPAFRRFLDAAFHMHI